MPKPRIPCCKFSESDRSRRPLLKALKNAVSMQAKPYMHWSNWTQSVAPFATKWRKISTAWMGSPKKLGNYSRVVVHRKPMPWKKRRVRWKKLLRNSVIVYSWLPLKSTTSCWAYLMFRIPAWRRVAMKTTMKKSNASEPSQRYTTVLNRTGISQISMIWLILNWA